MKKLIKFPAKDISLGEAWAVVKRSLNDESLPCEMRVLAIRKVAEMETHNSIAKADLVNALRWLFEHYDFES